LASILLYKKPKTHNRKPPVFIQNQISLVHAIVKRIALNILKNSPHNVD
jgi:hypothetical protein